MRVWRVIVRCYAKRARKPVMRTFLVLAVMGEEACAAAVEQAENTAAVDKLWREFQAAEWSRAKFPMELR